MARAPRTATTPTDLGSLVRRLRKAANHTQESLAEEAGISQETVSAIERGAAETPQHRTMLSLSRALGTEPGELYLAAGMASRRSSAGKIASLAEEMAGYDAMSQEDHLRAAFPDLDEDQLKSVRRFASHIRIDERRGRDTGRRRKKESA